MQPVGNDILVDWPCTIGMIQIKHWLMETDDFDAMMLDKWGIVIHRNNNSVWKGMTKVEVDNDIALLLALVYPESMIYQRNIIRNVKL